MICRQCLYLIEGFATTLRHASVHLECRKGPNVKIEGPTWPCVVIKDIVASSGKVFAKAGTRVILEEGEYAGHVWDEAGKELLCTMNTPEQGQAHLLVLQKWEQ